MLTSIQHVRPFSPRALQPIVVAGLFLLGVTACESSAVPTQTEDASALVDDAAGLEPDAKEETSDADTEPDAGEESDAAAPAPPSDPEIAEGEPCETDAQCDDGVYCNGEERCAKPNDEGAAVCRRAVRPPCSPTHPCQEARRACDCSDDNKDGDPYVARECGGDDCDDSRADCYPGAIEICDPDGRDEDCDPLNFNNRADGRNLDGDADGDGFIDARCRNQDPDTGDWHGGVDCDDHNPSIHPMASEVCDYHDNNCNGFIDEKLTEDGPSEPVNGGLMVTFYPDLDRDLYGGGADEDAVRACDFLQPPGYILATEGLDCDDHDRKFNPDALEICDGRDNDCDGLVDSLDGDMRMQHFFPDTSVACLDGREVITACPAGLLWCPELGDPLEQGCRRNGRTLDTCGACDAKCKFACGAGCDEVSKLALGSNHSCALTSQGHIACFGQGSLGRLGSDDTRQSSVPVMVMTADARDITSGFAHSCAIIGERRAAYCWGDNSSEQLGHALNGESFSAVPVPVKGAKGAASLTGVRQMDAGRETTCAVLDTGHLVCFGQAAGGMLANDSTTGTWAPVRAQRLEYIDLLDALFPAEIEDAAMVALGAEHGCLLTVGGTVDCWGSNARGQLGIPPSSEVIPLATPVPGLTDVEALTAGRFHTCALLKSGEVSCWGDNGSLQLGREGADTAPALVPGLSQATSISAGLLFTCARTESASVICWGNNSRGQLGVLGEDAQLPTALPGSSRWLTLAAGAEHVCARAEDDLVHCWGANGYGQLGVGAASSEFNATPTPLQPLTPSAYGR